VQVLRWTQANQLTGRFTVINRRLQTGYRQALIDAAFGCQYCSNLLSIECIDKAQDSGATVDRNGSSRAVVTITSTLCPVYPCNWQKDWVLPQFNSQSPGGDMDRSVG